MKLYGIRLDDKYVESVDIHGKVEFSESNENIPMKCLNQDIRLVESLFFIALENRENNEDYRFVSFTLLEDIE